jgi:hypothetical protein
MDNVVLKYKIIHFSDLDHKQAALNPLRIAYFNFDR